MLLLLLLLASVCVRPRRLLALFSRFSTGRVAKHGSPGAFRHIARARPAKRRSRLWHSWSIPLVGNSAGGWTPIMGTIQRLWGATERNGSCIKHDIDILSSVPGAY
ncbi:hypothetical protein B0T22DRAFT_440520 [Podospora appendiculata]|uniref:Secreted protein n=1 Tax=Podospora appendiculata TaxID=314037 RepID=A0AAE1CCY7_9PEZI|nr:hypothetical protein B0T22DRAFT_440520 [Podospora appendiculata]